MLSPFCLRTYALFQSNCVDIELRSTEKRGLMCILDEEALFPAATDDSFLERIFVHLADSRKFHFLSTEER